MNSPVLILYTSALCLSSKRFIDNYNDFTRDILNIYPDMNIIHIHSKHIHGRFNENMYPSYLLKYNTKFPNIILIPGSLWNIAMKNLGFNSNVKLTLGVRSFASTRKSPNIKNILLWLSDVYNDEFKNYNNMSITTLIDTFPNEIYSDIIMSDTTTETIPPEQSLLPVTSKVSPSVLDPARGDLPKNVKTLSSPNNSQTNYNFYDFCLIL